MSESTAIHTQCSALGTVTVRLDDAGHHALWCTACRQAVDPDEVQALSVDVPKVISITLEDGITLTDGPLFEEIRSRAERGLFASRAHKAREEARRALRGSSVRTPTTRTKLDDLLQ